MKLYVAMNGSTILSWDTSREVLMQEMLLKYSEWDFDIVEAETKNNS